MGVWEREKIEKLATGGTEPKGEERGKDPARNGWERSCEKRFGKIVRETFGYPISRKQKVTEL